MAEPANKKKWELAKKEANKVYKKPSAYKSGFIVKKYKEMGGTFKATTKAGIDSRPLKRWFEEKWTNQHGTVGYTHKNDVYRPTKRVTSKTPRTWSELPKKVVDKAKRSKSKGKRAKFSSPKN